MACVDLENIPPLPWGTGGVKPPGGGLGVEPWDRTGTVRRGPGREPRVAVVKHGIRLPSALFAPLRGGGCHGVVHVLIRCFHKGVERRYLVHALGHRPVQASHRARSRSFRNCFIRRYQSSGFLRRVCGSARRASRPSTSRA